MKKISSWIVVLGVLAILGLWVMNTYNKLVEQEETVEAAWSQVENQYQRRADLVPNLVATVKGYAAHEQATFEGVMEARAKATQITIDPANATPEQLAAYQAAQGELTQALGRLMAVAENYPELKANENFLNLQSQLEGTENRCTIARQQFNETARVYNTIVRRFPGNIIAMVFGFERKPYFEADEDAKHAPKVEF
ncbi:MAG: LemA family protein [Paludibacteraceae bacterium]|nr:LemA family protein [Paludibacteraceae bacterium]